MAGARIGETDAAQIELVRGRLTSVTPLVGGTTEDSVSSTSPIRSEDTAARGIITSMKVAIITDIRICTR